MNQASKVVLINEIKKDCLYEEVLNKGSKQSSKNQIYIDEYKLLDYKSDLIVDSKIEQHSKNASFNTLKVIVKSVLIISLIQSFLYAIIIPNNLSLIHKAEAFFIIFGWNILFNSVFFIPGIIKFIAIYSNEAFTAYKYL